MEQKKQSSIVRSYLSAIRAVLKIDGIKLNEYMFLVNALTRACKIKNDKIRTRHPIHKSLLHQILWRTHDHFLSEDRNQPFLACLFQTLFATAYYGLFQIGELTSGSHPVLAKDIKIGTNKKKIKFILHTSKTHGKGNRPQIIKISSTDDVKQIGRKQIISSQKEAHQSTCPYRLL